MLLDSTNTDNQTYYQLLNIKSNCTAYEIKKAYREHALTIPSRENDNFDQVIEAYEVLSDPDRRFLYDLKLKRVPHVVKEKELAEYHWGNLKFLMQQFNLAVIATRNTQYVNAQARNELIIAVEDIRDMVRTKHYNCIKEKNSDYLNHKEYQNLRQLSERIKNLISEVIISSHKKNEVIKFRNEINKFADKCKSLEHKLFILAGVALGYTLGLSINELLDPLLSVPALLLSPFSFMLSDSMTGGHTLNNCATTHYETSLVSAMDEIINKINLHEKDLIDQSNFSTCIPIIDEVSIKG